MSCFGDRTNSSRYANQAKSCCFSPKTPKSGVKRTVKGFLRRLSGSKDTQVNIIVRAMEGIMGWLEKTVWIVGRLLMYAGIVCWLWVAEEIVSWLEIRVGNVGGSLMKVRFCQGLKRGGWGFVDWPWQELCADRAGRWGMARDERGIVSWPRI